MISITRRERAGVSVLIMAILAAVGAFSPAAEVPDGVRNVSGAVPAKLVFDPPYARFGGTARGFSSLPAAELRATSGGIDLPLSPRLPAGTVFMVEFEGLDRGFHNAVLYKNREISVVEGDAAGKAILRVLLPDEALAAEDIRISVA
ncbi:MAG: hypothetical protein WCT14_14625, partial [Treponemataceae bacterium]